MPARKFTDRQYDQIVELREAGKTHAQIAAAVGCSVGTVKWMCLRLGAASPRGFRTRSMSVSRRASHTVTPFSAEDDRRLLELEAEGLTYSEIGRRLGRRHNSVQGRLLTLARREEQAGR